MYVIKIIVHIAAHKEKLSFAIPTYLIWTIQTLEKFSVGLATKLALYLFFRPIPFKTPDREKPTKHKAIINLYTLGTKHFTKYEWGSGERQILVLHGWSGRATQFYPIIERLLLAGYKIIGIDAPGHGDNPEKTSNMLEFVDAVAEVQKTHGSFYAVIGHSLGGMALFNAIERHQITNRIIVIGTPASVPFVVQDFCAKIGGGPKMAERICTRISKDFNTEMEAISTNYLAQKNNPYGLVLHDEDDLDVPVENGRITAANWPNGTLHITKGLGHRRILNDEKVINIILTFLQTDFNK